jgi:hypothetical protein
VRSLPAWLDWTPVLVALPLYAAGLGWGYGPEALWSWDEPRPAEILAEPYGPPPSWPAKYPLLHRDLLRSLFALAEPVARAAGVGDPAAMDRVLFLVGRALTLLLALLTVRLIFVTARELAGRRAGFLASAIWLSVLPQAYYAKTMNLDAPYLFWFALFVFCFVRYRAAPTLPLALTLGASAAAAVLTKDQAYGLFLLPGLWLLAESFRRGRETARLLGAALVVALVLAASSFRLWQGVGPAQRHLDALLAHPDRYGFVGDGIVGQWELLRLALRHVAWSFGAPLAAFILAVLLAALFFAVRRRPRAGARPSVSSAPLLLFPVSYYLASIVPLGYHYDRFFLPVCWILSIVAATEFVRGLDRISPTASRRARPALQAALLLAIGWGVARAVAVDIAMTTDRRLELERETRGEARVAFYAHAVRPPHGFDRRRVLRGDPIPFAALSPYEVVAIPGQDLGNFTLSRLAGLLRRGACGFRQVEPAFAEPSSLRRFPGFDGVLSNLGEIDPAILVFRRDPPLRPCGAEATSGEPVG